MRKYILGLIILFSILNIFFCVEHIKDLGAFITLIQMILAGAMSASVVGCVITLKEIKNSEWMMMYCLFLISLFCLTFKFKFGLIMVVLSLLLHLPDKTNNKQDC